MHFRTFPWRLPLMMVTPTISTMPDRCWNTTTFPATVFLTTGYIRLGREFWWDELGDTRCSSQDRCRRFFGFRYQRNDVPVGVG